jgi:flavin prenyltransferase
MPRTPLPRAAAPGRLVVAITGASGAILGIRALERLHGRPGVETHLILSPSALRTIAAETDRAAASVRRLATVVHAYKDIGAAMSSGSFRTLGMLVAPCSIKTLSGIANSYDDNLVVRAADVCLKERRPLVLLLRETPLHLGHIELMQRVERYGATVMPPVPALHLRPKTVEEMVDHILDRALAVFGLEA